MLHAHRIAVTGLAPCSAALSLTLFVACSSSPRQARPEPDAGAPVQDASVPMLALRAEGRYLRDEADAVVVLRGLNVAGDSKVPDFRPIDDLTLLDPFPGWGVNLVRLLFTWEALEAERTVYDESYLRYYEGVLDGLAARGIWAIVDVHQDAFSRYATDGCGEGIPGWAVSQAVMPDVPDNGPNCKSWALKSVSDPDTKRSWDDFYADENGVRTRYLAMLELIAARFGNHPAVLGYDMLNEPLGDEPTQLAPLWEDGAMRIRKHDADAILFVSPQAVTSAGVDTRLPKPTFSNFVYSPHYYDPSLIIQGGFTGKDLKEPMDMMFAAAERLGGPLLLAEFGAPPHLDNIPAYIDAFYVELDARFSSGTQWTYVAHWSEEKKDGWNMEDFSIVDQNHEFRANYRIRPYPARIAGEPGTFDAGAGKEVTLTWSHVPARGATRIFAPRMALFGGRAFAELSGELACGYEPSGLHLRCTSSTAGDKRVLLRACEAGETCL